MEVGFMSSAQNSVFKHTIVSLKMCKAFLLSESVWSSI